MLLGLKEAAKALDISYSTLSQMTDQGDIEWVPIGNRKDISRETLLELIKRTLTGGTRSFVKHHTDPGRRRASRGVGAASFE